MMDRRSFVGALGSAIAVLPLGSACGGGDSGAAADSEADAPGSATSARPIGVQLYTVRNELQRDFEGTLTRVAEIGYREVELAGFFDRSAEDVRRALDAAGLVAPSGHYSYQQFSESLEATLADARAVGNQYVVLAWIEEAQRTRFGYQRLAELSNRVGEAARQAGMRFAYHNHEFEFEQVDGVVAYDLLLGETDPENVLLELDLFWIRKGGADPLAYFNRWPGRFHMVHAKDMDGSPEQVMTEVGSGVIDFAEIASHASHAGIRHWFVEHDNPASPFDSIRQSYEALTRVLAS
jgi:sugar phosphate isomerase/epimerase